MKKKAFLAFMLLTCSTIGLQATDRKVTRISSAATSESAESYDHYLYNPEGQLMWVQSSTSNTRDVYTYDAQGLLTQKTTLSWLSSDNAYHELNRETYQYDGAGQLSRTDQLTNIGSAYERHYVFTGYTYQDGKAMGWHMEDVRGDKSYRYDYKVLLTRDGQGRILTEDIEEYDYDYPEDGFCAYEGHTYTYRENGDIDTEVYNKYNYSYDKVRKSETRTYTYSDLDAAFAPRGLKAEASGKTIQLSWHAVEGATGYVVTYDMERKEVSGTTFTATDIAVGEHEFTVQAIVNGEEKNAAVPVIGTISDPGMLAAENLQAGTPRISVEETDNGPRTFYIIPLQWSVPAGHSEIRDTRIYYTSAISGTVYQPVGSPTATSYELKIDEYDVRRTNEAGDYTCGADMEFYVTLIYGSGESEASNILKINPYNVANGLDTPDAITVVGENGNAGEDKDAYTLTGIRAGKAQRGIIIRNGKKIARN